MTRLPRCLSLFWSVLFWGSVVACEIMWENDEGGSPVETPRARWERMRRWVVSKIRDDQPSRVPAP